MGLEANFHSRAAGGNDEERALGCCQGRPRTFRSAAGYMRGGFGITGELRKRDGVCGDTSAPANNAHSTSAIFALFGLSVRGVNTWQSI